MSRRRVEVPARAMVAGVGARAHHGLSALQVTMSVRAQHLDPSESHLVDKHGEPVSMCRVASIGDDVVGFERFVALAAPAMREAMGRSGNAEPVPVFLALPHRERPGYDPRLDGELFDALEEASGATIHHRHSRLFPLGRAGGIHALLAGLELIESGGVSEVLVGGVDSYFDPDVLEHLDRELRLHSLDTENGMLPGEGAAFLRLARAAHVSGALAAVYAAAVAKEPHPYGAEEPCLGAGITTAARQVVEAVGSPEDLVGWVLTDVVDERHRVDEWSYAMARLHRAFTAEVVHDQPLLSTGDVGAAAVPMLAVVACMRWHTACGLGDYALLAAHSDGVERGAAFLSAGGSA
ncbi:MAG: hypothetical protein KC731_04175 [Myxococcales bacterium]|nr:hypothetical protein [Myxococcales bacterium]